MTEETIKLILPYPPGSNNMYFDLMRNGRIFRIPKPRLKEFKKAVVDICQPMNLKPFRGDVEVLLRVYRPRRIGDLDGTFKAVFDSLKGFAYEDDKQIAGIVAKRLDDKNNPRIEIEISAASGSEQSLF